VLRLRLRLRLRIAIAGYARADDNEQINGVDNSVRLWDLRMLRPEQQPLVSLVDDKDHMALPRNHDGDPVLHVDMEPGVMVSVRETSSSYSVPLPLRFVPSLSRRA
jgi:hypothetical protein